MAKTDADIRNDILAKDNLTGNQVLFYLISVFYRITLYAFILLASIYSSGLTKTFITMVSGI